MSLGSKHAKEVLQGTPPNYTNLTIFNYGAYTHVYERKHEHELELKVRKFIFLCYAIGVKCHKLWSL